MREKHTLQNNDVTGSCLMNITFLQTNYHCSWSVTLFELIGSLLNFDLLVGIESRSALKKDQLSINVVWFAFFRMADCQGFVRSFVNLEIVLAAANVACKSSNRKQWLYLWNSHNDSFQHYERSNVVWAQLANRFELNFGIWPIYNIDSEFSMHFWRDQFIAFYIARLKLDDILIPLDL